MTVADGGEGSSVRPGRWWDVALSFAGTERDYVGRVAQALKARRVRCFYDADEQVRLWGTYLAEELPRIYARESAAVVVFVSADYAGRDWTRLERRAAFSRAVIEAGVYVLPARFDDSELPELLPDVVAVDLRGYTPEQFADLVVAKLADLGVSPSLPPGEADRAPPGGVRVSEADPRRLGVHAAISVPGMSDEVPPEYVPRDADAAEHGVRARVTAAAQRGGFVLLVGGSSVGKTRCAAEAVKALLPGWWLVHPLGPDQVAALAAAPTPRTVVWLDELQRYLDGEHGHGLTGGVIRALLGAPYPAVIIGTLWPDRYTAYTALPVSGGADPHAREREVLDLAAVIHISPEFSKAEQDRARTAAARDRRLKIALESAGYGMTQTLAAAPQLVARWEDAKTASPYAWAVLTAALDAARLGARSPLSVGLLRAAAPGYCTPNQQAEAPADWFEQALAYATGKLHGAAAALSPAGADMGQVAGYTVADYLIQHASRERRSQRVPALTWQALIDQASTVGDQFNLAVKADRRLLYCYAEPLYGRLAASAQGPRSYAAHRLAELLVKRRGPEKEIAAAFQIVIDIGESYAPRISIEYTYEQLIGRLRDQGRRDVAARVLRAWADAGDRDAAMRWAELLMEQDRTDQAVPIAHALVPGNESHAAWWFRRLLIEQDRISEAMALLRAFTDVGGARAADALSDLVSVLRFYPEAPIHGQRARIRCRRMVRSACPTGSH